MPLGKIYIGDDNYSMPMKKRHIFWANWDLHLMELRCSDSTCEAIHPASHPHQHCQGRMSVSDPGLGPDVGYNLKNVSIASYSGQYSPVMSTVFAKALETALEKVRRNVTPVQTQLKSRADRSKLMREFNQHGQSHKDIPDRDRKIWLKGCLLYTSPSPRDA